MENGIYKFRFWTPHRVGTGVVVLSGGLFRGGDTIAAYSGRYRIEGDQFFCDFRLVRHSQGMAFVILAEDANASLQGPWADNHARLSGNIAEVPGLVVKAEMERFAV